MVRYDMKTLCSIRLIELDESHVSLKHCFDVFIEFWVTLSEFEMCMHAGM